MNIPSLRRRVHIQYLLGVLACYALSLLLYHSLQGGTLLSVNGYDSYSLQAMNWLNGRNYIANGEYYDWLELAIYNGRYYHSFPPVPAVLMLPWVIFFGENPPSNLAIAIFSSIGMGGVYACFWRQGFAPKICAYFSVFSVMGSNLYWLSTSGGVWFLAQVCGFSFAVWGIYAALCRNPVGYGAAGFCFAAAVGCRPFYVVLLLLWAACLVRDFMQRRCSRLNLVVAALPVFAVAAAMMSYNYVRFGSVAEFGHNYLPEFLREESGQFNLSYLLPNLLQLFRPITLDSSLQLHFEIFNGFLFFVANPLFLLGAICGAAQFRRRFTSSPSIARSFPFSANGFILTGCGLLVVLLTCMHRTLGGWQFGARYLVDVQPYVLLWFLASPRRFRLRAGSLTLCAMAILFNLYGAVYIAQT